MVEYNTIKLMNKPNTVNLMNKSGFYSNPNPHIFSNVYLIVFILSISLIAIFTSNSHFNIFSPINQFFIFINRINQYWIFKCLFF